jgi:hypothetical protein
MSPRVASARALLVLVGLVLAIAGVYVVTAFDPIMGLSFLVVGAFLMFLPFTALRGDE